VVPIMLRAEIILNPSKLKRKFSKPLMSTTRQLVLSEAKANEVCAVLAFIKRCASANIVVRPEDIYKEAVEHELLFKVIDEDQEIVAVGMLARVGSTQYYELAGGLVARAWQNLGILSTVMPLIAASAILHSRSACLVALIAPDNDPSIKLMTNAGFVRAEEYVEGLLRVCSQCKKSRPAHRRCCNDPYVLPQKAHFDLVRKFLRFEDTIVVLNSGTSQTVLRLACKAVDSESRNGLAAFVSVPASEPVS
jgi:N-acetylglutamate synthase-like GNAT family acetyltransferase